MEDLASEGWVRFTRGSLLDEQLGQILKDAGLTAAAVARASRISRAVRLVAHGLGVTMIPASAVPLPCTRLAKPLTPALSERVLAGLRRDPGPAETALLDLLRQQDWSNPATVGSATPHLAASGGPAGRLPARPAGLVRTRSSALGQVHRELPGGGYPRPG